MASDTADGAPFLNRDLSWLAFNQRVLEEAQDEQNPLLERCKFLAIVASNLDEFVMVRLAELATHRDDNQRDPAGLDSASQFTQVRERFQQQVHEQYRCWGEQIKPALATAGLHWVPPQEWNDSEYESLASHYRDMVEPTLTPLAVDPTRPFPLIANLAVIIAVALDDAAEMTPRRALVVVPKMPRMIALPGEAGRVALLEDVIETHLHRMFPGHRIRATAQFRVTRDASIEFEEDSVGDFLTELEEELRNRGRGQAIRLEVLHNADQQLRQWMMDALAVTADDVVALPGPLDLSILFATGGHLNNPDLSYPPFQPRPISVTWDDPFAAILAREHLLHHPYDSFDPIVELVREAARDPQVLAIKQTLYRVSGESPIVHALVEAAHNGKQVTVLVELKARFDEAANIRWARRLEEAGAHVVYGLMGLKVHAKLLLIIRRDEDGLRRYCHLGTGNYNDKTAKMYTDISVMTANEAVGRDVAALFNVLTGFAQPPDWERLAVAPSTMRQRFVDWIRREADHARQGHGGRIIAKFNSLVDEGIVHELYAASQVGVRIDLIVRGMCILTPGVPGWSEHIRVRSIIGRYLEHSRIFYFANHGHPVHAIASADWMTRNLDRRVEHLLILTNPETTKQLDYILRVFLDDTAKTRFLQHDGSYQRAIDHQHWDALNAQAFFSGEQGPLRDELEERWLDSASDPLN